MIQEQPMLQEQLMRQEQLMAQEQLIVAPCGGLRLQGPNSSPSLFGLLTRYICIWTLLY